MFGSASATTTNNNWGSSTGFGSTRRASTGGGPPTGTTSSLFGNANPSMPDPLGSLAKRQNTSFSGGASSTSGGLFGNSGTTSTTSGGLFGNSGGASSGFTTGAPTSTTTSTTGGLFGNSNTGATTSTGGLFGNKPNVTSASQPTGGLFGNSGTNQSLLGGASNTGGLFGKSTTSSGGLFGSQPQQQQPQMSFNQPAINQLTVNNTNPYSYHQVLSNLQASTANMPESITTTIFSDSINKETETIRKRRFSYLEPERQKPKSSLLTKLGQTFRFIRNGGSSGGLQSSIKGLFTQSDVVKQQKKTPVAALPSSQFNVTAKSISKPSYKAVDSRRVGSMKRLIIKSKPVKYHLIDVNKVFNAKRRKIIPNVVTADKLLSEKYLSDDDDESDDEALEDRTFLRYPYKLNGDVKNGGAFTIGTTATESVPKENGTDTANQPKEEITNESHDGYWSTPTIAELSEMSMEELSNLENFIVGRIGCGQIAYNYPVDLTQVVLDAKESGKALEQELFDNIIQIQPKVIVTYKDSGDKKPPMGFGLNVPATITLEGVKPKPGVSAADHIKYLKAQIGMEFVTYDPITHVWVFKVKHFSVWGLVDDEDVVHNELAAMKRKQDLNETQASIEYSRIYENEKYNQELKKQKLNETTKMLPGRWEYTTVPQDNPLNIKRNLVSNEILQELNKYQDDEQADTNALTAQVSDITIDSERDEEDARMGQLFANGHPRMEEKDYEYLKQMISVLPPGTAIDEIVDEKVYEPEITNECVFDNIQIKSDLPVSDNWTIQLEMANSLNSALAPYNAEVAGSGELHAGKVDSLLFPEYNRENINLASTPTKTKLETIEDLEMEEDVEDIYCDNIPSIFHTLLINSTIVSRENKYPKISKTEKLLFKDLELPGQIDKNEQVLVGLAISLFDNTKIEQELSQIDARNVDLSRVLTTNTRKQLFADWLKTYNQSTVSELLNTHSSDPLEQAFIHMCAGNLTQAIEVALGANSDHLAVIATLADSNHVAVRSIASNQLTSWKERNVLSLIPKAIVKIYQILAGELDAIVAELPWNIALTLKLFYGDDVEKVKDLIKGHKQYLPTNHQVADVLKLYALDKIHFSDISSTSINKKLKWLFCKILLTDGEFDEVSVPFGDYLQLVNYWKEAIIVYSHLSDDNDAKKLIRKLVISKINYIKGTNIDEEEYLVKVLRVPQVVIYDAVSIDKRSLGDYWGECEALITVQLWERAHETIIGELGPLTVISNSQADIDHLLSLVDKFPQQGLIIPNWNIGAGVYANYLHLLRDELNIDILKFLLTNIPQVKDITTFNQKAALKLISKKVGDLVIESDSFTGDKQDAISKLYLGQVEKQYFNIRLS